MSSTIRFVNWMPESVTPVLNQSMLSDLKTSTAAHSYFPYSMSVPRQPDQPPSAGVWGNTNNLVVKSGGKSQIYNNLTEPENSAPNQELILWVFPDFVIFSQFEKQLGEKVFPG
ncbi:Uncharacterised protein [BD1-7 clade bacterium]|uniref:Uncharacterized protein n=1 Tax=BD1-7 clade bacterium TaxID=2029982 RepID=A0A5S9N328_9GAMM|nr:Uncharacterised protein [BD1-7 clade bacterium]CAA0083073.1 Uncharacterised protein [BD1-7 clade bacterium]CAA0116763.1 Uncharacterised protein [BD1-7 clade bacterium]